MVTLTIAPVDPRNPQVQDILHQSHDLMRALFDPEDNNFLSIDELCADHVHLFGASLNGQLVGTGAVAAYDGYGEVKSMFTLPAARGHGVARALLDHIEAHARTLGLPMLRLETGDTLTAAQRLYSSKGFALCGAFGDYDPHAPHSVYMEKSLS